VLDPLIFSIAERSQIGEARRRVSELAASAGLGEVATEKVALLVNELGSNLVKHAGGGELIARDLGGEGGVEVLVLDRGAGMTDVEGCFADGFSTASSPGTGLGAVRRLASFVDVYSARPGGTAIVARVSEIKPGAASRNGFDVGAVSVPKSGEEVCGDGWLATAGPHGRHSLVLVDGLGHGLGAADAARAALRLFAERPDLAPAQQVAALHEGLRGTRGAAVAVGRIDPGGGTIGYAGVGNIASAVIAAGTSRQLVSLSGTAGHVVHRITEFSYPWAEDALLIMHSDGLGGRWDLSRYPGLARRDPSLVAGVLFRDWGRRRDDVTVVAARAHRS
jgi:anti-sigma regulatory factor (Ser/Thr protein kinase)